MQICPSVKSKFFRCQLYAKQQILASQKYLNSNILSKNINIQKYNKQTFSARTYKRNRRPKLRKYKDISKKLKIFSCNAASLNKKLFSFSKVINALQAAVFCIQESHMSSEGKIKFLNSSNYQIFEKSEGRKVRGRISDRGSP